MKLSELTASKVQWLCTECAVYCENRNRPVLVRLEFVLAIPAFESVTGLGYGKLKTLKAERHPDCVNTSEKRRALPEDVGQKLRGGRHGDPLLVFLPSEVLLFDGLFYVL